MEPTFSAITWSIYFLYEFLTSPQRNSSPLLLPKLHQLFDVWGHLSIHSSLKVPPQHLNGLEVWTLTSKTLILFFLSHSVMDAWSTFGQALAVRRMVSHFPVEYVGGLNDCEAFRSCASKTTPNHHPSTIMLDGWHGVLVGICRIWLLPNMVLCVTAKQLHFGWSRLSRGQCSRSLAVHLGAILKTYAILHSSFGGERVFSCWPFHESLTCSVLS